MLPKTPDKEIPHADTALRKVAASHSFSQQTRLDPQTKLAVKLNAKTGGLTREMMHWNAAE